MRKLKNLIYVGIFIIFSPFSFAQIPTMVSTISYINNKFEGKCKIDVVRGELIALYFDKGKSTPYREDNVRLKDLDPANCGYESADKSFYIPCADKEFKCVDRRLVKDDIRKEYKRINFVVEDNQVIIEGLKKAFIHMAKMVEDNKYKEIVKFE